MTYKRAEIFRIGEVWQSPRGYIYKVTDYAPGKNKKQAVLRPGRLGIGGRKVKRDYDDVINWVLVSDEGEVA